VTVTQRVDCLQEGDFFRSLEVERTQAIVARHMERVEQLHASDYELITPAGRTFTRARYLGLIAAEPFYAGWSHGPMQVRVTMHMAIVRYKAALTFPSGRLVRCWHTDSYEIRAGQWQAVWSQATELPAEDLADRDP